MLNQLRIERFRGISELSLDDTGRVNLIVGRNDSGKTTVLEAIRLLLSGNPRLLRRYPKNLFDRSSRPPADQFKLAFHHGNSSSGLFVHGELSNLLLEIALRLAPVEEEEQLDLGTKADEGSTESLLERGEQIVATITANKTVTATVKMKLPIVRRVAAFGSSGHFIAERSFSAQNFPTVPKAIWLSTDRARTSSYASRYSNLIRNELAAPLLNVLRLIEPTLVDLVVLSEFRGEPEPSRSRAVLEARLSEGTLMPMELLGDGFTSVISIVTAVGAAARGLCLIDEIENGIHYSVLPSVWTAVHRTAVDFDSQVWATTHSLDCVSAAYSAFHDFPDALRVHRLDKGANGRINVHTFDHEMLGLALSRGLEVR